LGLAFGFGVGAEEPLAIEVDFFGGSGDHGKKQKRDEQNKSLDARGECGLVHKSSEEWR
jgi:hypothetical protein